jgi:hypothetical protein
MYGAEKKKDPDLLRKQLQVGRTQTDIANK